MERGDDRLGRALVAGFPGAVALVDATGRVDLVGGGMLAELGGDPHATAAAALPMELEAAVFAVARRARRHGSAVGAAGVDGRRLQLAALLLEHGQVAVFALDAAGPADARIQRLDWLQRLVVRLGQVALRYPDEHRRVLDQAASTLAAGLGLALVSVMELNPAGDRLLLRAGFGWQDGEIGQSFSASAPRLARALAQHDPVAVEDARADPEGAPPLTRRRIRSGMTIPIRVHGELLGLIGAHSLRVRTFNAEDRAFAREVAHLAGTALLHERIARALAESERLRTQAMYDLLRAEEDERARIAAELHDDTVQVLVAALVQIDRAVARDGASGLLDDLRQTLLSATERTRSLMFQLRPELLADRGLKATIHALADQLHEETGARVRVRCPPHRYPTPVETAVYRTVREALTNVRRHARASEVSVDLRESGGRLQGTVRDNGRGFDTQRAGQRHGAHLHLGLIAAAERLRLLGGDVEIRSAPGEGTVVRFSIDLGSVADEQTSGRSWPAPGAPPLARVP